MAAAAVQATKRALRREIQARIKHLTAADKERQSKIVQEKVSRLNLNANQSYLILQPYLNRPMT